VRHAEVLDGDRLDVRPLRSARATDRFILSGQDDTFEPTMTYHGFRFIEVSNWPGELTRDSIEAVVVHSDISRIGHFSCSEPDLNQLHSNVVWSTKGNFFDLPTDCPQRDERFGWTGDIAVFAPTAAFLFDVQDFLEDWLIDLGLEQHHRDGLVPMVVPDPLKQWPVPPGQSSEPDSTAIWSDAAVWVPWALFRAYGDPGVLARHYDSMAAHLRHVAALLSPDGTWSEGFQFGDWLDPLADPHEPWNARANAAVVATACVYRTSTILTQAAAILGRAEDATAFRALAERTRAAFHAAYVTDEGAITSDAPTVYALAITFGLLEGRLLERAGERLSRLVREAGHHVSTGFAGTPFISDALTQTGHLGDAYRMLLNRECPSWLYPVTQGATTIWERWDSMLPDGTLNPGEMTSFNHYALGAVADWMHRTIGGISPLEPGYGRVLIAPQPGGGLTWAECALETRRGRISVRWRREDELALDIELPPDVSAVVRVTGHPDVHLPAGPHGLQHAARFSSDQAANQTSSAPGVLDATR
jgi:alpha-L-rhamnosidase